MSRKKYKYVILGNKGNGRTTLYNAIERTTKLLNKEEINIYPDILTQKMSIVRLWSVIPEIDTVILVLSAENGLTAEVRQYALLIRQLGFEKLIVYINKADLVDEKSLKAMEEGVMNTLKDYDYNENNIEILSGSALDVTDTVSFGIEKIKDNSIFKLINIKKEN